MPTQWDKRKREIQAMIEQARLEAPLETDIDAQQEKVNQATAAFLAGEMSWRELCEITDRDDIRGSVFVDTLPEFRAVMELEVWPPEYVVSTLAHENDHMLVDRQILGARSCYRLHFMKTSNGGFAMRPSVWTVWPDNIEESYIRQKMKESLSAPEYLSDGDRAQLNEGK
jgi:hypothetical protein